MLMLLTYGIGLWFLQIQQHVAFTDLRNTTAVRALDWCPFQRNLLASGGGNGDQCIKLRNTQTGARLNSVETGSQVCALLWNKNEYELFSSHGFSENPLILWKYPSMAKMEELNGHPSRVLHMTQSPNGGTRATATVTP